MSESTAPKLPGDASGAERPGSAVTGAVGKARNFTEIAVERGYCSQEKLDHAILDHRQLSPTEDLAAFLVRTGVLSQEQAHACQRAARGATVIAGFELIQKVGQGGMGAVFKARQLSMDRIVALKILPKKLAEDPKFKERFLYEARLSAKLSHINIISGIDCGEQGGYTFFAMEFVDGKTVKEILKQRGKLPPDEAYSIIHQVAQALVYAEANKLVHRDIKPDNIMLTSTGVAKLCDLGLAKQTHVDDAHLTQAGQAVGTPHFISPEQARGEHHVDTRTDIYSLGASFYNVLTGRTPFSGPTGAAIMALHITDEAPNPCDLEPGVPLAYGQIISQMMAKQPAHRYASAKALLDDLVAAKARKPVQAAGFCNKTSCAPPKRAGASVPAEMKPAVPADKSRAALVAMTGLVLILSVVAGYFAWRSTQKPDVRVVEQKPSPQAGKNATAPNVKATVNDAPQKSDVAAKPAATSGSTPDAKPAASTVSNPPAVAAKKSDVAVKTSKEPNPADDSQPKKELTGKPPADVAVPPKVTSSVRLPPLPPELPMPKLEATPEMLYARFLAEMAKLTGKADLQKAASDVRELAAKPEFAPAQKDIAAELNDFAAAQSFEQDALKAKADKGGYLELSEETAKKWGTAKGKIVGYEPGKGVLVELNSNVRMPIPAAHIPQSDIVKSAPDQSPLALARYYAARGSFKDAFAALVVAENSDPMRVRWDRKLKLALTGERELMAQAAVDAMARLAEAKSWLTFTKMCAEFQQKYGDTAVAAENVVAIQGWKSLGRAALTPNEGLEAAGRFNPVKWFGVIPCTVTLKVDPVYGNKTIVVAAEAGTGEVNLPPPPPADEKKPKRPALAHGDRSAIVRGGGFDFAKYNAITFRARHNSPNPLKIAVALIVDGNYFESPPVQVPPDGLYENTVLLEGATFKTPQTNFLAYDSELPRPSATALCLVFLTQEAFSVELDAIAFCNAEAVDLPRKAPADSGDRAPPRLPLPPRPDGRKPPPPPLAEFRKTAVPPPAVPVPPAVATPPDEPRKTDAPAPNRTDVEE